MLLLAFTVLNSCTVDNNNQKKETINEKTTLIDSVKIVLKDSIIDFATDTLINDYASIVSGKQPVKYFRTICSNEDWNYVKSHVINEWKYVSKNKIIKIEPWADSVIQKKTASNTLIYPFAGADFLYPSLFYNDADSIVMIGLEDPGSISVDTLDFFVFLNHISKIYKSLFFSNHAGFFRTNSMKEELNEPELHGTIPPILYYISSLGYTISSLKYFIIDSSGNFSFKRDGNTLACEIDYFGSDKKIRRLFYIKYDLSDYNLGRDSSLMSFLNKFDKPSILVKSASYLMHKNNFSMIRNYILNKSYCLLQDDTGIPYKYFDKTIWDVSLFGKYSKTISIFKNNFQPDLSEAYKGSDVEKMPISIGYNTNHGEPNFILAVRKKISVE